MQNWKTRTQEEENDDGSVVQYSRLILIQVGFQWGSDIFSWPCVLRSTIPAGAVQEEENTDE